MPVVWLFIKAIYNTVDKAIVVNTGGLFNLEIGLYELMNSWSEMVGRVYLCLESLLEHLFVLVPTLLAFQFLLVKHPHQRIGVLLDLELHCLVEDDVLDGFVDVFIARYFHSVLYLDLFL